MIYKYIICVLGLFMVCNALKAQDPTSEYFKPVSRYQTHFIKPHKAFSFGVGYNPSNKWINVPFYIGFDFGRIWITKRSAILISLNVPFGYKNQVNTIDNSYFTSPLKEKLECGYLAPRFGVGYSYGFAIPCYISAKTGVTKSWEIANYRLVEDESDFITYKENNNSPFQPFVEFELYGYFNTKSVDTFRFGWSFSTLVLPMQNGNPLSYNVGFFWSGINL